MSDREHDRENALRPGLELVIFDCDGVLVDSERIGAEATSAFVSKLGLAMTPQEAHDAFLGLASPQVVEILQEKLGRKLAPETIRARDQALEDRMHLTPPPPIPGALDLLAGLQALKVPMRVGSNSLPHEMEMKFRHADMERYFPPGNIHSATALGHPKPSPFVYEQAARAAGVPPERCVVIEDSDAGAEAALKAGMSCLLLRPEGRKLPPWWPAPHFQRISSLSEALPLIRARLAPEISSGKLN
ncbi:HAD family hydrolase [Oecophyllibacter saccharovorans]|uniref:HAD family hydrolase n=1 Tax=Oecophyllibacter saccharovorans TaxID=2558360 RepID=UPI001F5001EB|nr:HAD family phosphatase [Oecophyllibacter saccharovorans]